MSWSEWDQIKADAAQRQSAQMRLNGLDGNPGASGASGGSGDLVVNKDDLGAIGHEAYLLHGRLSRDGDHARPSTFSASIALTNGNFTSGSELLKVHDRWNKQLRTLLDACARISNHLDYSKSTHAKDDADIRGALLSVSKINEYFK
ncbi:hypothetical protein [Streptomyces sp. CC208A]|uniref:hypothetical protein n=1 Tax=Streptomyces sp. CC208A TaxID=3044573 RepID=UPI0024A89403|nr:hypothetical protein [Streptomyces sp. CC208A]